MFTSQSANLILRTKDYKVNNETICHNKPTRGSYNSRLLAPWAFLTLGQFLKPIALVFIM